MALSPLAVATRGYLEGNAFAVSRRGYLDTATSILLTMVSIEPLDISQFEVNPVDLHWFPFFR